MSFADRFKKLRNEKGYTQEKVAHDLDVPESTVRRWETGKGMPKNDRLPSIGDYFGVTVDFLMGRSDIKTKHNTYTPTPQELAIRDLVERYNIDVTRPEAMEKLEKMVQLVFEDIAEKSKNK